MPKLIYTIGHSTRSLEDFIDLLKNYAIEMVIDVRTIRKSRHNSQFNEENVETVLKKSSVHYQHKWKVLHIINGKSTNSHKLTSFLHVENGQTSIQIAFRLNA